MASEKKTGFLAAIGRAIDKGIYETHHMLRTGHFSPVGNYERFQKQMAKTEFKKMDAPTAPGQAIEKKPAFNMYTWAKQQYDKGVAREKSFKQATEQKINGIKQAMANEHKQNQVKQKEAFKENNKNYEQQLKATPEHVQQQNKQFESLQKPASQEKINGKEQAFPYSGKFMPQKDIQQIKDLSAEIKQTKEPEGVQRLTDARNSIVQKHKDEWKKDPQAYSQKNAENYLTNSRQELKTAVKGHEEAFKNNPASFEQTQKPQLDKIASNQQEHVQKIEKGEQAHQMAEKSQKLDKSEQFQTVQHGKNDRHDHNEQFAVIPGKVSEQEHLQNRSAELMQGMKEKMVSHAEKSAENGKAMEANKSISNDRGAAQSHAMSHGM